MTKKKTTKHALLMSALSLMLCVSMLVGTTYAWFTDSVTSAGNIIKSGTLDVTMEWFDGKEEVPALDSEDWKDASKGAIFNSELWEPGYTEVRHIKIANEGTLALKYQLNIIANGEVSKLSDVIDVYYADPATQVTSRDKLDESMKIGTLTDILAAISNTASGELEAGDAHTITLALKMQESAGNEYQNLAIGSDFSVQLLATQLTSEYDSFDNLYDLEADYAVEVDTLDELRTALRQGGLVTLTADIDAEGTSIEVPAGVTVELDLNGKTISGDGVRDADNNRIHTLVNNGNMIIKNGTVASNGGNGGSAIYNKEGAVLTIEEVTILGAPQGNNVHPVLAYPSYGINNYGYMTVNGADIKTYHGGIATVGEGETVINDADIDVGMGNSTGITSWALYTEGDGKLTVNGGNFANTKNEVNVNGGGFLCENGSQAIVINGGTFSGGGFNNTGDGQEYVVNAGTFTTNPTAWARGEVKDNDDGTWTVKPHEVQGINQLKKRIEAGQSAILAVDITIDEKLEITQDAYIDGNGKTLTYTGSEQRAIDIAYNENEDIDVTIKNLTVACSASNCERGINYNENGTLILDNVIVTGDPTYGINMPGKADGATIVINGGSYSANEPLNIWGENMTITATGAEFISVDNSSAEGEDYFAIGLNKDPVTGNNAEGTVVTIRGGKVIAFKEDGVTPSVAVQNMTDTGEVNISDTTEVIGTISTIVAIVKYESTDNFYSVDNLQEAVEIVESGNSGWIELQADVTIDSLEVNGNIKINTNGNNLTIGSYTGAGTLTVNGTVVYSAN